MSETRLLRQIQIKASRLGARLFRNNTGMAWSGVPCAACRVIMRRIRFGLAVGSSDLIGWKPFTITQEMVGRTIAVFWACEVKDGSPTTKEQKAFLEVVIRSGGIGIIAHSTDDIKLDNRE